MAESETVAAPAVATEQGAPAQPEIGAPTGSNAGAIKQSGRNNARALGEKYAAAREAAREHHSQTQPRDEAGKFTEAAAAAAASATVTEGSAPPETATTTEAADGPPEGMVRIEYPEGHPLRAQGETHIDVPASFERAARTMVNGAARRAEAEQAERRAQEAEAARMRAEATLEWYRQHGNTYWTPEDDALYDDIIQSYTPTLGADGAKARAEAFKRGREADAQRQMGAVAEQADMRAVEAHWSTKGEAFRSEALRVLPTSFPGLTPQEIQTAIGYYAMDVQAKQEAAWSQFQHRMSRAEFERRWAQEFDYSEQDFMAVAGDYLKTRPGVIQASSQAQATQTLRENQIRAEAEAAQQAKLREAAQRHAQNPQRALGGVTAPARTTDTTPPEPDRTKMGAGEIKRDARERARAMGEALGRALGR